MRYLVTGATGFVGSYVVDRLLDRDESVRALARPSTATVELRRRGVEVWAGDLTHATDLVTAVDGMDVVINCAALVPGRAGGASSDAMWNVNLTGTERLLAAAAKVSVGRFVHLSSIAVYGCATPPVPEDAPKRPAGPYGQSKWAAEQALWRAHAEHDVPTVALRPCIVYGPRDRVFTPGLLRRCRTRLLALPDGGRHIIDLVFVSDVVDAVLAAATSAVAIGHAYNLTDGEIHTLRDVLMTGGGLTGRRPAVVSIPGRAYLRALYAASWLLRVGRVPATWRNVVEALEILQHDVHYAIDAARRDLGYVPQAGLTEGLRRSIACVGVTPTARR